MDKIVFPTIVSSGSSPLSVLDKWKGQRIFIVTDTFILESGILSQLTKHLGAENELCIFSNVVPDPPVQSIVEGLIELFSFKPTLLFAVGGGSAIDTAKGMKYFALKSGKKLDIPLTVIPTTSGAGSEVTNFAVITDEEKGIKYPIVDHCIQPNEAMLVPEFVESVPPSVTADTGMDVLTHAIEAYVSTKSTDFSDALCEKVVQMVFDYLPRCFKNGHDLEARTKMHTASCMAGMAFNLTSLGLNHGIAHAAGAKLHIPHGRMNAILLPEVIAFNADLSRPSGSQNNDTAAKYAHLSSLLEMDDSSSHSGVRRFIRAIKKLRQALEIPEIIKTKNISNEELTKIAKVALADGCTKTNPRVPLVSDIEDILRKII